MDTHFGNCTRSRLNQAKTRFLWRYKLSFSILLIFNSSGKEEHLIMLNDLSVKLLSSQDTDIKQSTPSRELTPSREFSSTFFFLFCFLSFLWGVLGNSHSALFLCGDRKSIRCCCVPTLRADCIEPFRSPSLA